MRVRIHPSFTAYLLCIAVLSSYTNCICILLTLIVHEAFHYGACLLVGEQIEQVELTPCGGVMTYKEGTIPHKGIKGVIVHASGPMGNYLFLIALCLPMVQRCVNPLYLRSLFLANSSMLLINLLPVFPLDGGHIVFCLGYYFFPVAKLIRFLSALGTTVGGCGIALSVYGFLFQQQLNCSLLIISIHLFFHARKEQKLLLAENIFTVIHERLCEVTRIKRIQHYLVMQDEPLTNLLPTLREGISVSYFFWEENLRLELTEYAFCQALLEKNSVTVKEAYLKYTQQYKKAKEDLKTP